MFFKRLTILFGTASVAAASALAAPPPLPAAPPLVRTVRVDQLAWDGLDGQLSMEFPGSSAIRALTADDFYLGSSSSGTWQVREARALFISNRATPPSPSEFRMRLFRDAGRSPVSAGARPGALAHTRTGATSVIDRGPAIPGYRLYEVVFSVTSGVPSVPARSWHWLAVDHIGPTYGAEYFLATHRRAGLLGAPGKATLSYPAGAWTLPLFAPSDFAVMVRATAPLVLAP